MACNKFATKLQLKSAVIARDCRYSIRQINFIKLIKGRFPSNRKASFLRFGVKNRKEKNNV